MNLFTQFNALFKRQTRSIAKITRQNGINYIAQTDAGNEITLSGNGYSVGDKVYYDRQTGRILDTAPNLEMVELVVE